jgi:ubiquinone/menaquinone biosynthesis C-methylase UbiE
MKKPTVFDYQAQVGLTKHLGGLASTLTLISACKINDQQHVLEVGCGVGASAVYIASEVGCNVTGVDVSERMIQRARERARDNKLEHLAQFRTAEMHELPFSDETFDVVYCESVLAFSHDKAKAIAEMARVLRPGGHIGINESVWLHEPTEEWIAWFAQDAAANASTLSAEAYRQLFEAAGFNVVFEEVHSLNIKDEARGLIQRYGISGVIKSTLRGLAMYFQRGDYRQFVSEIRKSGVIPSNPEEHIGYGILIAQK